MRALYLSLLISGFSGPTIAETTCDVLARSIPQDVLIQGSTLQQFQYQKRLVCSAENGTWVSASAKKLDISLSVPSYVDSVLGSSSNAQNWGQNFKRFCELNEQEVSSDQAASLVIRHASTVAYQAVVECVKHYADQNGIFGLLEVSDRRDAFAVKVTHRSGGSSQWEVRGFSVTPKAANVTCNDGIHSISLESPRVIDIATFTIACEKDPQKAVLVTVNTDAGTLPTFRVASIDDDIAALKARVNEVEANAIPRDTVAWFQRANCPAGWEDFKLAHGRTIFGAGNTANKDSRGSVITNWGVGQVGGEESHQLTVSEMPSHSHTVQGYGGGDGGRVDRGDALYRPYNGSSGSEGGGQPHSIMPPFVALTPCIRK